MSSFPFKEEVSLNFMATIIISTDSGAHDIKPVTASTFSLSNSHEVMGLDSTILVFECWVLSQLFYSLISPSTRGSLLTLLPLEWYHLPLGVANSSSGNLNSSLSFIQPGISHDVLYKSVKWARWQYTALTYSFPNLKQVCCFMSGCNCCFLTHIQVSQETGKVVWFSIPFKILHSFFVIHTIKGFCIVNETDVFLEFPCFLYDPANVGNLISGSSAFSKSSFKVWKIFGSRTAEA